MKQRKTQLLLILTVIMAAIAYWVWPRPLQTTYYSVPSELEAAVRIVQLTDLHGRMFGENNAELISMVALQEPDLIFMTGDMLDKTESGPENLCSLIRQLQEVAPVYYSYGNHETQWMTAHQTDLYVPLTAAGATVLEMEYADVAVNGQALRIGGYAGYYRTPEMETTDLLEKAEKYAFAFDFENTDRQKLFLAHITTSWLDWKRVNSCEVGVVFCGHYHGGMIRFPLISRGLIAPYVGLFPPYTKGVFCGKKSTCVLSAGLGRTHGIPRIYNPPEIVVVDLLPGKT